MDNLTVKRVPNYKHGSDAVRQFDIAILETSDREADHSEKVCHLLCKNTDFAQILRRKVQNATGFKEIDAIEGCPTLLATGDFDSTIAILKQHFRINFSS